MPRKEAIQITADADELALIEEYMEDHMVSKKGTAVKMLALQKAREHSREKALKSGKNYKQTNMNI